MPIDELCHGYHVWIHRGRIEKCALCAQINDESRETP